VIEHINSMKYNIIHEVDDELKNSINNYLLKQDDVYDDLLTDLTLI